VCVKELEGVLPPSQCLALFLCEHVACRGYFLSFSSHGDNPFYDALLTTPTRYYLPLLLIPMKPFPSFTIPYFRGFK